MRIFSFLPLFLLFIPASHSRILINEIMPNPIADESLNEWIELYNNGTEAVNVSTWAIGDGSENDTIEGGLYNKEGTVIEPFGFAIVTDDNTRVYNNFNASSDAVRLYVNDSSIGNGLLNDGETIYLYFNSIMVDKADYPEAKEGFSISLVNGVLMQANPTPGYLNINATGADTCDYEMSVILSNSIFDSANFSFRVRAARVTGSSTNISGSATIENLFGDIVKEYALWTNESISTRKTSSTYSPNLPPGSYVITANVSPSCFDANGENNFVSEIFTIRGEKPEAESELKIKSLLDLGSDKTVKFGETARVSLEIYKGDTNKKSVAVWVENKKGQRLSKQSRANVGEKFSRYEITLPVQIIPNCDGEFKNDSYAVVAEGLDHKDEERIEVEGITKSQCMEAREGTSENRSSNRENPKSASPKNEPKAKPSSKPANENEAKVSGIKEEIKISNMDAMQSRISSLASKEPIEAYQSSSEKSRKLALIFLLVLSSILNIVLIWRR